jgi:hypothetical protein
LIRKEAAAVARINEKFRARGQLVTEEREEAAEYSSWMDRFVSIPAADSRLC